MNGDTSRETPAPKGHWNKPLLIVSLAFNLIFAGLIAGAVWKHAGDGRRVPKNKAFEQAIEQFVAEMPAAGREAKAKSVLERLRNDVMPMREQRREAGKRIVDAITADPYDEQRLADAFAELRRLRDSAHEQRHALAVEIMRDMTPQERRKFLEIYRSKRYPGGKGNKDK